MIEEYEITKCRSCNSEHLTPILSLGNQYVTNFIKSEEEQKNVPQVPLDLILCEDCKLLQLKHNAPPESMWSDQYWYKSGISLTIKEDLKDIVEKSQKIKELQENDIVIDIGCNDGTMLEFYEKDKNLKLVGFEPSGNVAKEAGEKGLHVINNFFNAENFKKDFGDEKAKLITAISMFYDLEDPNTFLEDIVSCLDTNGLFVIQQNYLVGMLENNAFDNICHEHREYYSLISMKKLLDKHNLEIFDVDFNLINGGSIRTYIKLKENHELKGFGGSEERLKKAFENEIALGLDTLKPYQEFASRIDDIKKELLEFLIAKKAEGKKICIYGAGTRGNVILQYFDLSPKLIEMIADKNPDKWGTKTIGSLIDIDSPEKMREMQPDYLLVNTWHFFDEIQKQEAEYFNKGGKFMVAIPKFKVLE
jgi:NDP-4-keto-2,6-dideoxyhexose 3-C-methyltransferase